MLESGPSFQPAVEGARHLFPGLRSEVAKFCQKYLAIEIMRLDKYHEGNLPDSLVEVGGLPPLCSTPGRLSPVAIPASWGACYSHSTCFATGSTCTQHLQAVGQHVLVRQNEGCITPLHPHPRVHLRRCSTRWTLCSRTRATRPSWRSCAAAAPTPPATGEGLPGGGGGGERRRRRARGRERGGQPGVHLGGARHAAAGARAGQTRLTCSDYTFLAFYPPLGIYQAGLSLHCAAFRWRPLMVRMQGHVGRFHDVACVARRC